MKFPFILFFLNEKENFILFYFISIVIASITLEKKHGCLINYNYIPN